MTSFNRIADVGLVVIIVLTTTILRDEWGFEGFVICDFNTCSHMVTKDMFYSGNDLNLESAGFMIWNPDYDNANDVTIMKECSKTFSTLYLKVTLRAISFSTHQYGWYRFKLVPESLVRV